MLYQHNPSAKLRLFCFPFGGGNASVFHGWPGLLSKNLEVWCALLPGRGVRMAEKPITDVRMIVQELREAIPPYLDKPFAFFGHSMGALIAFELSRELQKLGLPPRHIFFSGHPAPHLPKQGIQRHTLPADEFIENVKKLGGIPKEIADNKEALEILLPILRADIQAYETHVYEEGAILRCSASAFGGLQDADVPRDNLERWRDLVEGAFSVQMFPGDHFFVNSAKNLVTQQVAHRLEKIIMDLRL
jgi:medium-chain acyl-[acyl-carrier-protein] hydrolase